MSALKSKNRIDSLLHAMNGLKYILKETNFIIHICLIIVSFIISFIFKYSFNENLLLVIIGGILLFAEAINTSIEKLCNFVEPNYNQHIKIIKDISAGSVLIIGVTFFIINILFVLKAFSFI